MARPRTRTGDTTIFSRVLYQLSYLAAGRSSIGIDINGCVFPRAAPRRGRCAARGLGPYSTRSNSSTSASYVLRNPSPIATSGASPAPARARLHVQAAVLQLARYADPRAPAPRSCARTPRAARSRRCITSVSTPVATLNVPARPAAARSALHHVADIHVVPRRLAVPVQLRALRRVELVREDRDHTGLAVRALARAVHVPQPRHRVGHPVRQPPRLHVRLRRPLRRPVRAQRRGFALLARGHRRLVPVQRPARRGEHDRRPRARSPRRPRSAFPSRSRRSPCPDRPPRRPRSPAPPGGRQPRGPPPRRPPRPPLRRRCPARAAAPRSPPGSLCPRRGRRSPSPHARPPAASPRRASR